MKRLNAAAVEMKPTSYQDVASALEELWRKFFADPSQWWDNRSRKRNLKFPDFVHSTSKEGLWINRYLNPPWVEGELDSLKQGDPHSPHRAAYQKHSVESCEAESMNSVRVANGDIITGTAANLGRLRKLCEEERFNEALQAVDLLQKGGSHVSTDIFYCLLQGCMSKRNLTAGRELYCLVMRSRLESNTFLGSHLIRMFAVCGSLLEANEVFGRLRKHTIFTWSAIITAHARFGLAAQAVNLYRQMQQSNLKPDEYIFASVLKACAVIGSLEQAQFIHAHIVEHGFESDFCICNALIDTYVKCGSLEDAYRVFDRLPKQDVVAWTALISGHALHGCGQEALLLFQQMEKEGMEPDNLTFVSILKACTGLAALNQGKLIHAHMMKIGSDIDAYIGSALIDLHAKCGNLRDAYSVFGSMPKHNVVTWTSMMKGFALNSDYGLVLHHFEDMQRHGLKPDDVAFACVFSAFSHMGLMYEGCNLFQLMQDVHGITSTLQHYTCMADIMGRAGCLTDADDLLQSMPFEPDGVGWATLLSHCRTYGDLEIGRRCFDKFVIRDDRTSTGYVLMSNILTSAGMLEDASTVQDWRIHSYAWKKPGKAVIEVDNNAHDFIVGDKSHSHNVDIHAKLKRVTVQLKEEGYMPYFIHVLQPFPGKEVCIIDDPESHECMVENAAFNWGSSGRY